MSLRRRDEQVDHFEQLHDAAVAATATTSAIARVMEEASVLAVAAARRLQTAAEERLREVDDA